MDQLPARWSEYLQKQPETGMDYHVVSVKLADGSEFDDVTIIHCSIVGEVRGHSGTPFDPESIVQMEVTHNKWQFGTSPSVE